MDEDHYATNLRNWDERAAFHLDTPIYRSFVEGLRAGSDALKKFDDRVLGDLTGLDVLHLQCHVGTDTLSLARRGARVVGVDFSETALDKARGLSRELGIPATFVHGNVLDLPAEVGGPFDLVYTSYGVLCWLGDLRRWARNAASRLREGGRFVVIDGHPFSVALAEQPFAGNALLLSRDYLDRGTPDRCDEPGSYADAKATTVNNTTFEWNHSLADVANAMIEAGLVIEAIHEDPETFYRFHPALLPTDDGLWRLPDPHHGRYPLTFTMVARRAAR
jgi:SAM-dependent methyltransferase